MVLNTKQTMSTESKKERQPNKFKDKNRPKKIRIAKKEKKEFLLSYRRRKIQTSNHEKLKVVEMPEDTRKVNEILLERKLKLSELLTVKKEKPVKKSKKPAKHKAEQLGEVKITAKKPRRAPSKVWTMTERSKERLLEKQRKRKAVELIESLNKKAVAKAKKGERKPKIAQIRKKMAEIKAKEEQKKKNFEDLSQKTPGALPRKQWRMLMNGRKEGHKNRQKNRIIEVRKPAKILLSEYTTKKGQTKNRYISIANPELRKIVVVDRTSVLPKFEKENKAENVTTAKD